MENTNEKKLKFFVYGDRIAALFVLIYGAVFLAFPEEIIKILPAALLVYMVFAIYLNVSRVILSPEKKEKISFGAVGVVHLAVAITIAFSFNRVNDVVIAAIGVSACAEAVECFLEILHNRGDSRVTVKNGIAALIHIIHCYELFSHIGGDLHEQVVIYGFMFVINGVIALFELVDKHYASNNFIKVLIKTYTPEIIFGMFLCLDLASVLLHHAEPGISSSADALWYCFTFMTTIGFGGIAAVTPLGRVISVILGLYGLVVIALGTSVIVSLYIENKLKELNVKSVVLPEAEAVAEQEVAVSDGDKNDDKTDEAVSMEVNIEGR